MAIYNNNCMQRSLIFHSGIASDIDLCYCCQSVGELISFPRALRLICSTSSTVLGQKKCEICFYISAHLYITTARKDILVSTTTTVYAEAGIRSASMSVGVYSFSCAKDLLSVRGSKILCGCAYTNRRVRRRHTSACNAGLMYHAAMAVLAQRDVKVMYVYDEVANDRRSSDFVSVSMKRQLRQLVFLQCWWLGLFRQRLLCIFNCRQRITRAEYSLVTCVHLLYINPVDQSKTIKPNNRTRIYT